MNADKPLPWAGDEFEGQGGSFVFDPKTGKRTRAKEPAPAAAEAAKTEPAAPSIAAAKRTKE